MTAKPPTTPWLRRTRWAIGLAAVACVGVGLHWVRRSALAGDVAGAVAGAGLCLGILALLVALGALQRMGGLMLRSVRRLEGIENRLAALEVAFETLEDSLAKPVDLTAVGDGNVEPLVAARVSRDAFPRLVTQPGEPCDQGSHSPETSGLPDSTAASISGQRELDQMVRREMERLRAEFADQVRREDYADALRTGRRIETLFPDSPLAEQFESIRQHLLRRTAADPAEEPASAI